MQALWAELKTEVSDDGHGEDARIKVITGATKDALKQMLRAMRAGIEAIEHGLGEFSET